MTDLLDEQLPPYLRLRARPARRAADSPVLVRVSGEIDAWSGPPLGTTVVAAVEAELGASGVLDLADVTLVSAAGLHALAGTAARLAETGRRLLLARCRPDVLDAVRHTRAGTPLDTFATVTSAIDAHRGRAATPADDTDLATVRAQARAVPGALHTRPLVAAAMRILHRRYELADADAGFALLRDCSQLHNLKLRALAAAFMTATPPSPGSAVWFAGRRRHPPPPVTFTAPRREWRENRGAFLVAVLDAALACMAARHGDVQLVDPFLGGLRLEAQRGLSPDFVTFFAYVEDPGTACGAALRSGSRVVVADVAVDPLFADRAARSAMLAAGARSAQYTPLTHDGRCLGMVSTLHPAPGRAPSDRQGAQLDRIGREAGAWLSWYQRTIVLDALEHLHQSAVRAAG